MSLTSYKENERQYCLGLVATWQRSLDLYINECNRAGEKPSAATLKEMEEGIKKYMAIASKAA